MKDTKQCNLHSSLSKLELPSVSFLLRVYNHIERKNVKGQKFSYTYFVNIVLHKYIFLHNVIQECV